MRPATTPIRVESRDLLVAMAVLALGTEAMIVTVGISQQADPTHIIAAVSAIAVPILGGFIKVLQSVNEVKAELGEQTKTLDRIDKGINGALDARMEAAVERVLARRERP